MSISKKKKGESLANMMVVYFLPRTKMGKMGEETEDTEWNQEAVGLKKVEESFERIEDYESWKGFGSTWKLQAPDDGLPQKEWENKGEKNTERWLWDRSRKNNRGQLVMKNRPISLQSSYCI